MAYNLMTEPSEYKAYNEGYEQGVADTEYRWRNSNNRAYNKAIEDVIEHLEDLESRIVVQRNNVKSIADPKMLIGMHTAVEDTLGWLKDQIKV